MLTQSNDLRVAVLCSHRAPGLDAILHSPQRGKLFDLACVLTSEPAMANRETLEDAGVPVLVHPIRRFHDECGTSLRDLETRRSYDALTVHVLQNLDVHAVLMLGYLYVATDVLIAAFPDRIFNIHDSDLTLTTVDGQRKYPGLHATRDAVAAGEPETRSSVHIVTPTVDGGPILMQSRPYPVAPFACQASLAGHYDIVKAYAYAQREWMMRDSWGELAVRTLELTAAGEPDTIERATRFSSPRPGMLRGTWIAEQETS
jgi:phosphoribosylglycinamide formyltransferase-1